MSPKQCEQSWKPGMIISHKHKFIFIKTAKTAGTSIEVALSKYCGERDVITPVSPEDEEVRKGLGYQGPQNYQIPFSKYSKSDWIKFIVKGKRLAFFNHASAAFIKRYIDEEVWNSYFKFCFERNPWDKVVSWYFWANRNDSRPPISNWIQSGRANSIRGYELYTIAGEIVVDKVFFYELIERELDDIARILKLPDKLELPRAKGEYRKDKRHYRDILEEQDREKISKIYAREIANFGYTW